MKHLTILLVTAVTLSCMAEVYSYDSSTIGKQCDASVLESCHFLESCVIASRILNKTTQHYQGVCTCLPGYVPDGSGNCLKEETLGPGSHIGHKSASASSVAAGVLIPLTLLAVVGALIYFGRRYQWWQKLRRVPTRQYDTVLIGAQMDGDDDPPIS